MWMGSLLTCFLVPASRRLLQFTISGPKYAWLGEFAVSRRGSGILERHSETFSLSLPGLSALP